MSDRTAAGPAWSPREALLGAGLALAFAPALVALARVWSSVDYLSHGFLVPVVAAWIALRDREAWADLPVQPDARGAVLLAAALVLYVGGLAAGSVPLQGLALVAAVAGALWWRRGPAWLRALAFPVAFLVFMVPPPAAWIQPLVVTLQLFVSAASAALLGGLGFPVVRDGNVLGLPGGDMLFVAEACSGVTSVITLLPLAVLLAALSLRGPLRRVLLVASVIPLAMAGNLVRVVATVLAAERVGVERATAGLPHQLLGLSTYVVACGLLLAADALLRRGESR